MRLRTRKSILFFSGFVIAAMVALGLLWAILWYFFDQEKLNQQLTQVDWVVDVTSDASFSEPLLAVDNDKTIRHDNDERWFLELTPSREGEFYQTVELTFSDKHPLQTFILSFWVRGEPAPIQVPILYSDGLVARVHLDDVVQPMDSIVAIALEPSPQLTPYVLEKITWHPKPAQEISTWSLILSMQSPLAPHQVMLLYGLLLLLVFGIMLLLSKQLSMRLWWLVLIVCWLLLSHWQWQASRQLALDAKQSKMAKSQFYQSISEVDK